MRSIIQWLGAFLIILAVASLATMYFTASIDAAAKLFVGGVYAGCIVAICTWAMRLAFKGIK